MGRPRKPRASLNKTSLDWIKGPATNDSAASQDPKIETPRKPVGTRQTYYLQMETIERVRDYSYWKRLGVSEVVELALGAFFEGKKVKPRPRRTAK